MYHYTGFMKKAPIESIRCGNRQSADQCSLLHDGVYGSVETSPPVTMDESDAWIEVTFRLALHSNWQEQVLMLMLD